MSVHIISRAGWEAKPWRRSVPKRVAATERTEFFVHYHGAPPPAQRGPAVPKNVQAIHLANGWSGTGYNFMVDMDGVVYEGRGWDMVGAHCPNHNRQGIGVYVAVGGDQEPTEASKLAVRALYDEACIRAGRALAKKGHRDGKATACPGDVLYAWVQTGLAVIGLGAAVPAIGDGQDSDRPVLAEGTKGRHVEALQQALVNLGYKIEVDGDFGEATRTAVWQFQYRAGIKRDGVAGSATYAALTEFLRGQRQPNPLTIPSPTDDKEIEMFLVDDPGTASADSPKQWLCDTHTRRWVRDIAEVHALRAMGVYHWQEKPETRLQRAALLAYRTEVQ